MAKIIDINNWSENPWFNTTGTRNKKIFTDPFGKLYYFKESFFEPGKDYKYEFWSEVIASFLGKMVQIDVLEYNVAYYGNTIGCISEFMVNTDKQELVDGGKYLQAFDSDFIIENRKPGGKYSFDFIEEALSFFRLDKYLEKVIEVIIFDALIGNGDRHQENWAFIADHSVFSKGISEVDNVFRNSPPLGNSWLERILKFIYSKKDKQELREEYQLSKYFLHKNVKFSPIYDSGSSLGRELSEEKISNMLRNESEFDAYHRRGKSEIHWKGVKLSHYELVTEILNSSYYEAVKNSLRKVETNFIKQDFSDYVNSLDSELPPGFYDYKIPSQRKEMIIKLVALRAEKLINLLK